MDELGCTGIVGRGSPSSAVVNQASREAVVLTLRAFILTPARSACLRRMVMGSRGRTHPEAGYLGAPSPSPSPYVSRFTFPSTRVGGSSPQRSFVPGFLSLNSWITAICTTTGPTPISVVRILMKKPGSGLLALAPTTIPPNSTSVLMSAALPGPG